MNLEDQNKPQILSCLNCQSINDENNNFSNSNCTNCKHRNEKESQRMMVVPDESSDDESCCSSVNDSEFISLDMRKLWQSISQLIKCIYRETNREFTENHTTDELCQAKEYVQILTQLDSKFLFIKLESILIEYVNEIRNQVLKHAQTCSKTSNNVQLFIPYLLDKYQTFIQAVKNVSTILLFFEENYLKSFNLTWLLYNQYLFEKLVYMDKKIQDSMSSMIDSLQPITNNNQEEYSPAEYTQLINRFHEFNEQMSEIACVYKDCDMKMNSINQNRNTIGLVVKTNTKKTKKIHELNESNMNSTSTSAVNIPLANILSSTIAPSQHGSNGSSIGSGVGGKESSSISSFDDYILDNNTSSSSFTKDESDQLIENNNTELHNQLFHGILNNRSPITQIQQEIDELKLDENVLPTTTMNSNDKQTSNASSTKKLKSHRRKENSNSTIPKTSLSPDIILPPKPPPSKPSKLQADLRSMTMSALHKTEIPACPSHLSAEIQSVSFTAGTFASITTEESPNLSSANQTRLSLQLSRKSGSSSKFNQDSQKSSFDDANSDFYSYDLFPELNSSLANSCIGSMTVPFSNAFPYGVNQRGAETKGRLQLKIKQRTVQNTTEQSKSSIGNKSKSKQCDNNIDDLVRFIDGDETITDGSTTKKNKKKKDKQIKTNPSNEDTQQKKSDKVIVKDSIMETTQPLSKRKLKAKLKLEQQEKLITESSTIPSPPPPPRTPAPSPVPSLSEKIDSHSTITEPSSEVSLLPEEEINWITISRKQSKHKPTASAPIPTKSKKQQPNKKTNTTNSPTLAQQKVIPEIVPNSNKQQQQQHATTVVPKRVQNPVKTQIQEKSEQPSVWATLEQPLAPPTSTLLATAPVFVPSSTLIKPNQINDTLPLEEPSSSSLYWNPNDCHPPGPVQRPISSFLPASKPLHTAISRCIQRPSSESRTTTTTTTSFPTYSPMNYAVNTSTSTWNDIPVPNSNQTQWKYPNEEPNDFPLYDPFNSGATLNIPLHNRIEEHFDDLSTAQDNDVDEMNALEKEIEDFKKYMDNIDNCFNRQS